MYRYIRLLRGGLFYVISLISGLFVFAIFGLQIGPVFVATKFVLSINVRAIVSYSMLNEKKLSYTAFFDQGTLTEGEGSVQLTSSLI